MSPKFRGYAGGVSRLNRGKQIESILRGEVRLKYAAAQLGVLMCIKRIMGFHSISFQPI